MVGEGYMNILIAEDEQDIRELLQINLLKEGYTVYQAEDGEVALKMFEENKIDLVILDIMMPKVDGFKVIKNIRKTSNVPVIFITARGEDADKVLGLGLGADDYIVKPFSPMEIIARIQAIFRRIKAYSNGYDGNIGNTQYKNGELKLDKVSCNLYKEIGRASCRERV